MSANESAAGCAAGANAAGGAGSDADRSWSADREKNLSADERRAALDDDLLRSSTLRQRHDAYAEVPSAWWVRSMAPHVTP